MFSDFTHKNVLITGGSRGIGRACAQLFSELNANIIITYKSNRTEAEKTLSLLDKKQRHALYQLEIAQPEAIEQCFSEVMQAYGALHV